MAASQPSLAESSLGATLDAGVSLLRKLPRNRDDVAAARERFAPFQQHFATLRPVLLVDRPPGAAHDDYDLLIDDPEGGTVALTWQPNRTDPWALEHGDHWAANFVLSVVIGQDRQFVTNQHALTALRFTADRYPNLMQQLVDGALLALEVQRERPEMPAEELQQTADEMRRVLGLHTAEATRRWMEQMQITPKRFRGIVSDELMVAKVKERIVAPEVERYFAEHRADFERVRYSRATMPHSEAARELASNARADGLLGTAAAQLLSIASSQRSVLSLAIAEAAACELPAPLRDAASGDGVGPFLENGASVVAQVLTRTPALLDEQTRKMVSARVLREWLDRRAAEATIRWHWM